MAAQVGQLSGRLALVTGGASGIGRAVCQRFAAEGARVAVADFNGDQAKETAQTLGDGHQSFCVDVKSSGQVSKLLQDVHTSFSAVPSIAVNCAGITRDQFLLKMEEEQFDEVISVNLKGTFLVTQAVARAMVEENIQQGSIVNIGSIVGKVGNMAQANYSSSKSAISGLTKTVAKELAGKGIRCNAVLPGFIGTPMTAAVPDKVIKMLLPLIPLGRMGSPEEIAKVCLFLASEESSYMTGNCLEVAGGMHM